MKTISTALAAHLAGEVTTLATCWRIARTDGEVFRFTDHDRDLLVEGELYLASTGYSRTAIASDADLAVDNLEVEGVFDSEAIAEEDLRAGRFDRAEVRIFLVNWADPTQGILRVRRGWFGEVVLGEQGSFRTELRGLTQALSQRHRRALRPRMPRRSRRRALPGADRAAGDRAGHGLRPGRHRPGGDGSRSRLLRLREPHLWLYPGRASPLPCSRPTTRPSGRSPSTARHALEAMEAWTRAGTVLDVVDRVTLTVAIDEPRAVDGWFAGGVLTFETGANAGRAVEVKGWTQATGQIELYLPVGYPIAAGRPVPRPSRLRQAPRHLPLPLCQHPQLPRRALHPRAGPADELPRCPLSRDRGAVTARPSSRLPGPGSARPGATRAAPPRGVDCAGLVVLVARQLGLADHDVTGYGRHSTGLAFVDHFRAAMDAIPLRRGAAPATFLSSPMPPIPVIAASAPSFAARRISSTPTPCAGR